jgi:hypothetical protein
MFRYVHEKFTKYFVAYKDIFRNFNGLLTFQNYAWKNYILNNSSELADVPLEEFATHTCRKYKSQVWGTGDEVMERRERNYLGRNTIHSAINFIPNLMRLNYFSTGSFKQSNQLSN